MKQTGEISLTGNCFRANVPTPNRGEKRSTCALAIFFPFADSSLYFQE